MYPRHIDYIGHRHVRLLVIERISWGEIQADRGGQWLCQCDCGNTCIVRGYDLKDKESCGCLWRENLRKSRYKIRKYDKHTINTRYWSFLRSAKERGYEAMSREEWDKLVFLPCHYCGQIDTRNKAKMACYRASHGSRLTEEEIQKYEVKINGIDRLDTTKGYVSGNCVPCCEQCNRMKLDYTLEEFLSQIERVYKYKVTPSSVV